jgi:uncharacterized damage-inducible protein DinB
MYRSVNDFMQDWQYESEATLKMLNKLSSKSLQQKVTAEGRSLGRLAWHLVLSLPEMLNRTGLSVKGPAEDAPVPKTAQEIIEAYRKAAREVSQQVKKHWQDADLLREIEMYGENWQKGKVLWSLILHQTHHRAQMTVLMRQAGLKVPGVYGPSREEWKKMNMPPME